MSQDKELEIQLQFLEEASEYLDTIESVVLGLAGSYINGQQMDAVLRAAHSVKGGAGMMGFGSLSGLAHRLEDSFKVLKTKRNSIEVDAELESLLLSAVDRLRLVLDRNRAKTDVEASWLEQVATPVFDELRDRLGDPVADDASTMLGADEGTNVAALLFETEVEGCLNRLESVIADPQAPCLEEEVSILAQELGGLGEMLQLEAFTSLCESILHHLEAAPGAIREIASSALSAWRRSQALVLVGQVGSLPSQLDWQPSADRDTPPVVAPSFSAAQEFAPLPEETEEVVSEIFAAEWERASYDEQFVSPLELDAPDETPEVPEVWEETAALQQENIPVARELQANSPPLIEPPALDDIGQVFAVEMSTDAKEFTTERDAASDGVLETFEVEIPEVTATSAATSAYMSRDVVAAGTHIKDGDVNWQEVKPSSTGRTKVTESQENTVRIPVRQLDRLNDLFGELTIARNGLGLHLERLRNLMEALTNRVGALEQSNSHLRTAYDTVAIQKSGLQLQSKSLVSSSTRSGTGDWGLLEELPTTSLVPSHENRFDALEMDRYSDLHLLSREVMETIVQVQEVTSDIGLTLDDTGSTARELNQTAKQLQTNLTRLRMRPLSDLVGRFSRALRDLSLQYGKQVELKVFGKGTLIDRSILEALSDPLMHLVRNSFDHGIEDPATRQARGKGPGGTIEIKAAHRGNQTIITVGDDGKGIDLDKIRAKAEAMGLDAGLLAAASEDELLSLIFEPGFSTADRVTDLSGRGVGMDVVRNNLKQIRGDIRVDTSPGRGTTFTLTVPFTLSVARVLLVESNGMLLAFPTDVIEEMLLLEPENILTTPGSEVLKVQEEMVPLTRLSSWLNFYCPRRMANLEGTPSINQPTVLMISQADQLHGIQVERCWGEREVAVRQVEGTLTMPPGFASCTILGDGKVVPLVDAASLLRWIASQTNATSSEGRNPYVNTQSGGRTSQDFYSGLGSAHALPAVLTDAGVRPVPPNEEARDTLLTPSSDTPHEGLIPHSPTDVPLSGGWSPSSPPAREARVATRSDGGASTNHPNLYVDTISQPQKETILVVDDSINVRRFLALALEKAGYLVEQAKDGQDAVEKLLGGLLVSAVICDIEMPRLDGFGFLARIKSDPKFGKLPVAMLTSRTGDKHRQLAMTLGATAYFSKPYNERELLQTLKQIIIASVTT